jgi:uncharacterized DUF497 family protein
MHIVWDEPKRLGNIAKHGYDFADLTEGFFASASIGHSRAGRLIAVGAFDSSIVVVIFAPLGHTAISIISMRTASRKERKEHDATTHSRPL